MMNDKFLDGQFLLPSPLSCVGEFLTNFSENSQYSALVKEIKTDKVLMTNPIASNKWGLTPQAMQGKTTRELYDRVPNFKNKEKVLSQIIQCEKVALDKGQSSQTHTIMRYNGVVSIQNSTYVPVFNTKSRPVAIFISTYDVTRFCDLSYLLQVYMRYYSKKKSNVVFYISRYLQLDAYFTTTLRFGELTVLLSMTRDARHKVIARLQGMSPRTIATYLASLKEKLKPQFDLYTVLNYLKDFQTWIPDIENF